MLDIKVAYNKDATDNSPAEYLIIWMHGLGADYDNFLDIVEHIETPVKIKFVFPRAPMTPITVNQKMKMRAWYDIISIENFKREVDAIGINRSIVEIHNLIDEMAKEFTYDKIFLAGFSQGGVISCYAGLNYIHKLAGIISLSSYLPDNSLLSRASIEMKNDMPILICHGEQDDVVPYSLGEEAVDQLMKFGLSNCQFNSYGSLMHSISWEEIGDITAWLNKIIVNS